MNNHSSSPSVSEIFDTILDGIGKAVVLLLVLSDEEQPLSKTQLAEKANDVYKKKHGTKLIASLTYQNALVSRLEGAGLVTVKEDGRKRMVELTNIGKQFIRYIDPDNQ
ncbi:hypothetical protein ACTWQB_16270 [Piscibacillus sp. B03]|uniref:hypothetical protein n=1 Tax=Piscibacillus sp. B03 TaxID=3457430 RepID=UPI003FCD87AF